MRILGFVLFLGALLLLARNVFAETSKPITLDIEPKVTATDSYNRKTFRVRIQIPTNLLNRLMSYSASCGEEIRSSQREIDRITYEWFEELTVTDTCIFQACLHRVVKNKVQNVCVYQEVTTDEP